MTSDSDKYLLADQPMHFWACRPTEMRYFTHSGNAGHQAIPQHEMKSLSERWEGKVDTEQFLTRKRQYFYCIRFLNRIIFKACLSLFPPLICLMRAYLYNYNIERWVRHVRSWGSFRNENWHVFSFISRQLLPIEYGEMGGNVSHVLFFTPSFQTFAL